MKAPRNWGVLLLSGLVVACDSGGSFTREDGGSSPDSGAEQSDAAEPLEARVQTRDQVADPADQVTVAQVTAPAPALVAIRGDRGRQPAGPVLGTFALDTGSRVSVTVPLQQPLERERRLHAVLHRDTGVRGEYEFDGAGIDAPFTDTQGRWISDSFVVTPASENPADGGVPDAGAPSSRSFSLQEVSGPEGRYTFHRIAHTGDDWPTGAGTYERLKRVTTNGQDRFAWVGFGGEVTPEFPFGHGAVMVAGEGELHVVADTNTSIPGQAGKQFKAFRWTRPYLHDGDVVFRADGPDRLRGIYASFDRGALQRIIDTSMVPPGPHADIVNLGQPSLDGRAMTFSDIGSSKGAVYEWNDGELSARYVQGEPVPGRDTPFDMFAQARFHDDQVGFQGLWELGGEHEQGLYTDLGGELHRVADSLMSDPLHPDVESTFSQFYDPVFIEDDGPDRLAFKAVYDRGTAALYQWDGEDLQILVDEGDPVPGRDAQFVSIGRTVSMHGQRFVFIGGWPQPNEDFPRPNQGIYISRAGEYERLIDRTQMLDGRDPTEFQIHSTALFGSQKRNIAFYAEFEDGSQGLYAALDSEAPTNPI